MMMVLNTATPHNISFSSEVWVVGLVASRAVCNLAMSADGWSVGRSGLGMWLIPIRTLPVLYGMCLRISHSPLYVRCGVSRM